MNDLGKLLVMILVVGCGIFLIGATLQEITAGPRYEYISIVETEHVVLDTYTGRVLKAECSTRDAYALAGGPPCVWQVVIPLVPLP